MLLFPGKRYPANFEDFYQSRLPGTFEEERAGKRMKLPTPETWETQVSLKGNKAKTWEDLIGEFSLIFGLYLFAVAWWLELEMPCLLKV